MWGMCCDEIPGVMFHLAGMTLLYGPEQSGPRVKLTVFAPISCDLMLHSGQSPLMNTGSDLYVTQFGMAGALL